MSFFKIFDTLSEEKKEFPAEFLRIYACGVTVYDDIHIGHARLYTCIDVFLRMLNYYNIPYNYVRNITDVDDKIIKKSQQQNKHYLEVAEFYTKRMHDNFAKMNFIAPNHEPKASNFIDEIIAMIDKLLEKGFAYVSNNKDILFDTKKFKDYGKLSKRQETSQNCQSQTRIAQDNKKNSSDFVLWKVDNISGPSWDTKYGKGRPGWHIECSAMINKVLGKTIDIHVGGEDLKFPHHENEIAQSESCFDAKLAKCWMHIGHLNLKGEKMSKSIGNTILIQDALAKYHPDTIRLALISAHYKNKLDFQAKQLQQADNLLFQIRGIVRGNKIEVSLTSDLAKECMEHLKDDLNTPLVILGLHALCANYAKVSGDEKNQTAREIYTLANILGLLKESDRDFYEYTISNSKKRVINELIAKRHEARSAAKYIKADQIRDELYSLGVQIYDDGENTWWSRLPAS